MSPSLKVRIGGMHCASCVSRVEQALGSVPGVQKVEIQLLDGSGRLALDATPDWERLAEALKPAGYSIEPWTEATKGAAGSEQALASDWDSRLAPAVLSIALGTVLMAAMPLMHGPAVYWFGLVIGVSVQIFWGRPFVAGMLRWMRGRGASMETLVGLGSVAALLLSISKPTHPYFEVAVFLVGFVRLGKYLETRARHRTGSSVRELLSLAPPQALLLAGELAAPAMVPASSLKPGDRIRILPGARVPADAMVEQGSSALDESWLTGESLPVEKSSGMRVLAGSRNGLGTLELRVISEASSSLLAQIIDRVERAQMSRPPIQRLADRVAARFVPAVLWGALLTAAGWLWAGETVSVALLHAVSVLVIACPCALGLATPAALVVGLGRASRQGILFKSGAALESLARARTFVFDKTGTLTEGRPRLESTLVLNSAKTEQEWLTLAASVETGSEHPLAQAFLRASSERSLALGAPQKLQAVPGQGIRASVDGGFVLIGTEAFLKEQGITLPEPAVAFIEEKSAQGATCVALASDFTPAALFAFRDTPRADARGLIESLTLTGAKVRLLSGDRRSTALSVARELGIPESRVDAEVLPHQKEARIAVLEQSEGPVVMVGDGINDAPSLARAAVSVSLLGASDAAIDAAQVMLMSGRISDLSHARALARLTLRVIRQNLAASAIYNLLGIPLAAGILESSLGVGMSPALAGAAMALSSVSVVTNSLRLRTAREPGEPRAK